MTIQVREFVIRDFERAQVDLYNKSGDFCDLSALLPSRSTPGRLQRAPGWSSQKTFVGFYDCEAIFYDVSNHYIVFVGIDIGDDLATYVLDVSDWTLKGLTDISGATGLEGLGGRRGRNVLWWEDDLYLIGDDNTLYSSTNYVTAVAQLDGDSFHCLCAYGDRIYAAKTDGSIERLNDAGNALEAHWTATNNGFTWDFLTGYRGYLYGIARNSVGTRLVVQVDSAEAATPSFQIMAELHDTGIEPSKGCAYCQFGNYLYFMPGIMTSNIPGLGSVPDETAYASLYRYRFSTAGSLELVATIECEPDDYFYLLPWRGYLLAAKLREEEGATITFYNVHDEGGVSQAIPFSGNTDDADALAHSTHGYLIVLGSVADVQGAYYAGHNTGLQDAYAITSRLDMGHPGKQKRLDRITVHLDGAETDFDVIIKYRTEENASWTTATTEDGSRLVTIGDLGVAFYALQVRVDLDDDSGNDADHRINAISVTYTIDA